LPFVKNKIKVVYNGISEFETIPKENSDKIRIFSISELHKNKGVDIAIRALALLPKEIKEKIIYSVAGDGEEKENLEKLAKELRVENIVKFLGFVPDAKKLLKSFRICKMAS
jgi:glycosyltransferase involved in cell wall biosynthesis